MTAVLTTEAATNPAVAGGKAAALATLVRAGFDVPRFLVVTPSAFAGDTLTDAARARLTQRLGEVGAGPFAVRSSGRDEDGGTHSHAGQYLTLLDIAADGVPEAVETVWRSGKSASLGAYRAARGLDGEDPGPAVIVQRLVPARVAGVAFSAEPASGRRDRMVVSAVRGLGDRLVAGEVDGDTYVLDRATKAKLSGPDAGALSEADLAALAALLVKVEAERGSPQDIEWAFEGTRLYLLQARPITTPLRPMPLDDPTVTILDNSNIVESYPGVVSPLTYSFARYVYARVYRAFVALLGVGPATISANAAVFDNMLARLDGRVYYNLINWYRALALLPGFSFNRAHMETMMGVAEPLPRDIADGLAPQPSRGLARLGELARMAGVGLSLAIAAVRLPRLIRRFQARLDGVLARPAAAIDGMPSTALAAEYRRIEAELLDRWDAPIVNDFLCMIAFGASRKLMERWAGPAGLELHNDIMIGQGDIVSAEPAQRIRRMGQLASARPDLVPRLAAGDRSALDELPALKAEVSAYLDRFGERCVEELKLESIPLTEKPGPLLAAIAAAASAAPSTTPRTPSLPLVGREASGASRVGGDDIGQGTPTRPSAALGPPSPQGGGISDAGAPTSTSLAPTSPLVGEVDAAGVGRGVAAGATGEAVTPPSPTLPHKGGGGAMALDALFEGHPLRRPLARLVLRWAKARVRDRENLRFERTRIFGRARRLFLAIGRQFQASGLIEAPRDVFLLTVSEVLGAIEGAGADADLSALARLRREAMAAAAARPAPPERVTLRGAVALGAEQGVGSAALPAASDQERRGTGCSAGQVRAWARVVRDPAGAEIARGEVLVASHTDPGWIALFTNASAIVVERGSLLSHSAIVARELGIPCVVGLKGATDWLTTGDLVEVDGAAGLVRRVDG